MGIQYITFFPHRTIPESQSYYPGIVLTGNVSTQAAVPAGTTVFAYHTSFTAWGRFTYLRTRKTQVAIGAPVALSTYGILSRAASGANSRKAIGVTMAVMSASQYGWVQTAGINFRRLVTDKGIVNGDRCIKDEATAGMLDTYVNTGTQAAWTFVTALADDSGSFQAAGKAIINHLV